MNEKEVMGFLKDKKNSSLEKLLTKIKLSKNLSFIGLAAIPKGIISVLSLADSNKNDASQSVGLGLAAFGAISLSTGFILITKERKIIKRRSRNTINYIINLPCITKTTWKIG